MKHISSKILLSFVALSLVAGAGVLLAACKKEHQHSYSAWQTVIEATCEDIGVQKRVCECGDEQTQTIQPLGHDYGDWTFDKASLSHSRVCSRNSAHVERANCEGETAIQSAATCEEDGLEVFTCSVCGGKDEHVLAALGHVHSEQARDMGNGTHSYHCDRCNEEITNEPCHSDEFLSVDSVSHMFVCDECGSENYDGCTFETEYVAPTCDEDGHTTTYCLYCSNSTTVTHEKTGHNWGPMEFNEHTLQHVQECMNDGCDQELVASCTMSEQRTEADCVNPGNIHYSCSVCGGEYDEIIPAKGHRYDGSPWLQGEGETHYRVCLNEPENVAHREVKNCAFQEHLEDSTCSQEGTLTKTCPDCNRVLTSTVEKKQHSYGIWSPVQKDEGYFHRHVCTVCEHDEELPCHFENGKTVAPTCLEQGYTEKICSECNFKYHDDIIEATGHKFGAWQTNENEHFHFCENDNCDAKESSAHTLIRQDNESHEPTCTEEGLETKKCSICDYVSTTIIPANGHTWGAWKITDGQHSRDCLVEHCGGHEEGEHSFLESNLCSACEYDGLIYTAEANGVYVSSDSKVPYAKKIVIPALHDGKAVHGIGAMVFQFHSSVTEVEIADGVTYIESSAFGSCSRLVSVKLPKTLKKLGENAFIACSRLASITLPDNLESIGEAAFSGTALIRDSSNWEEAKNGGRVFYIGKFLIKAQDVAGEYEIKDGTTFIDEHAFYNCTNLTSIILPAELTRVGRNAFEGCTNITSVKFKGSVAQWFAIVFVSHSSNPLYLHDNCELHIDLAEGRIDIPQDQNVQAIPAGTFRNDDQLQSITIPEGVKTIGARAFENCTGLSSITIPASVTHIYENAFKGCTNLSSVTFLGSAIIELGAFDNTKLFNDFLDGDSETLYIGTTLLKAKASITTCTLNPDTYAIAAEAFAGCSNLQSIVMSETLKYIGRHAFDGCTALTRANFGSNVNNWLGESITPSGSAARGVLASTLQNEESAARALVYDRTGMWTKLGQ